MAFTSPILASALTGRAGAIGLLLGVVLIAGGLVAPGPSYAYAQGPHAPAKLAAPASVTSLLLEANLDCLFGQMSNTKVRGDLSVASVTSVRPSGKGIGEPARTPCVYVTHQNLDGKPNAHVYVSANASSGVTNNHPIGAWYDAGIGLWAVANLDFAALPEGAGFNVAFTGSDSLAAAHVTTAANTSGHITYLDHPLANNNPQAIVQASLSWNSSAGGAINTHVIGVWYDAKQGRWALFNQDFAPMPLNATFHLYVTKENSSTFVQRATSANTYGSATWLDNPATNGKPYAALIVTPNWNPDGAGGTYNNHVTGVWYDTGKGKWAILNQDSAVMPAGASFNILVFE